MDFYAIPPLISSLLFLSFGVAVFKKSKNRVVCVGFFLSTLATFWWQFSWFLLFFIGAYDNANFLVKVGYSGITFIPITLFHFFADYTGNLRAKSWIRFYYAAGFIFMVCLWSTDLYISGFYKNFYGYYPKANVVHLLFLLLTVFAALQSFYYLVFNGKKVGWSSVQGVQTKYLIAALGVYCFAATDFFANYGTEFYPCGFLAILFCLFIIAYTILKYNLFEIGVIVTRATVFVLVYAVVLGLPLWLAYGSKLGKHAIWLMLLFATVGPFVYTKLRLAVEQKLFKQQKLQLAAEEQTRRQRAMDNFSASLAHEIQNPVVAVMGRASMVRESIVNDLKGKVDDKLIDYYAKRLCGIEDDVTRVANIIKTVREYSNYTNSAQAALKLDDLVQSFLYLAGPQFKKEGITLNMDIANGLSIMGNKVQLEEVLLNLADNAIHALSDKRTPPNPLFNKEGERSSCPRFAKERAGEAGESSGDDKQIWLSIKLTPDNKILIGFKDNGYGISKNLLEDIFLDFVTTKGSSEGLGMGLSHCRKIIALHKGKIWAESEGEGKGAAILVELPLV